MGLVYLAGWLVVCLRALEWLVGRLLAWLVGWLHGWLICGFDLFVWLVGSVVACFICLRVCLSILYEAIELANKDVSATQPSTSEHLTGVGAPCCVSCSEPPLMEYHQNSFLEIASAKGRRPSEQKQSLGKCRLVVRLVLLLVSQQMVIHEDSLFLAVFRELPLIAKATRVVTRTSQHTDKCWR